METIFDQQFDKDLLYAFNYSSPPKDPDLNYCEILRDLSGKKFIPVDYINFLDELEGRELDLFSKRIFKIYLYLYSKMKDPYKVYNWLMKGTLPLETYHGNSMKYFFGKVKEVNKVYSKINETKSRLLINESSLNIKFNKGTENEIDNQKRKMELFYKNYGNIIILLEQLLEEIETSLGSGKKL